MFLIKTIERFSKMKVTKKKLIFTPYYINQSRLFDLYALLNGGYNEYSEIMESVSQNNKSNVEAEINGTLSGFKMFNFGGSVGGSNNKESGTLEKHSHRMVQTTASMLSIVIDELASNDYISKINDSKAGSFINIPVEFRINSFRHLMNEVDNFMDLYYLIENMNNHSKAKNKKNKEFGQVKTIIDKMFSGDELLYETDEYAVIANIYDEHLYQSNKTDIIGCKLQCLGQIKRIFPYGTKLMKNTTFNKLSDQELERQLLHAIEGLTNQQSISFDSIPVTNISNKIVYQIEIIALFQT